MRRDAEAVAYALTVGSAAAVLISIAASQILFTLALITFSYWAATRRIWVNWPSYYIPLLAFMLITVVALVASPEPRAGLHAIQKFVLFPMGMLATNLVNSEWRSRTAYRVLLLTATVAALGGIAEFALRYSSFSETGLLADDPTLVNRITGPLGHWMTFSGVQLLVWSAGVPALMGLGWGWGIPVSVVGIAIILSYTRGAWLGAAAGTATLALTMPRRFLAAILLPVLLAVLISSPLIFRRVSTSLDSGLATNYSRKEFVVVGLRMIGDNPVLGVGPERVGTVFPEYYRGDALETFWYGHLHNNFLQIAAERGIPGLVVFLWFLTEIYLQLVYAWRKPVHPRWAVTGALAALTAFVVAGLTEYNFGDSEVLLLLLFIVSVPFGLATNVQENPHSQPR